MLNNRGDHVLLDIGGVIFRTTKTTLCSIDGYFAAMFRNGNWAEEYNKDPIFIDRDPMTFSTILSYLRSHQAIFSDQEDDSYLTKCAIESDYYQLTELSDLIEQELEQRKQKRSKSNSDQHYKVIKGTEASTYFNQGWSYVNQFYGNETFGCIATGTRMETIWFGNHCVACNEMMNYEKFLKHTTLFQPVMFVIVKNIGISGTTVSEKGSAANSLVFDQSFG